MCNSCGNDVKKKKAQITEGDRVLSCAAYGAVNAAARIRGAGVIIHGPRSCSYMIASSHNETIMRSIFSNEMKERTIDNIYSTDMDDNVSIFGGGEFLERKLDDVLERGYKIIFVVTTCVSGIIGDNVKDILERKMSSHPDVMYLTIPTDGNIMGDYKDGLIYCMSRISELVERNTVSDMTYVNLIGATFYRIRKDDHMDLLSRILNGFDLKVNCRFLDNCSLDSIKGFYRAGLDILISDDKEFRTMYDSICERNGPRTCLVIPAGIEETEEFITSIGNIIGKEDVAASMIEDMKRGYHEEMERYRRTLTGKRTVIYRDPNSNIDWSIKLIKDLGMDIIRIGCGPTRRDRSPLDSEYNDTTIFDYTTDMLIDDIDSLRPDIVIGDAFKIADVNTRWAFAMRKGMSTEDPLEFAKRVSNIIRIPINDGWKCVI